MQPYNPAGHCPKCGHDDIATEYHRADTLDCAPHRESYDSAEHIERQCKRCQFRWYEAPLD